MPRKPKNEEDIFKTVSISFEPNDYRKAVAFCEREERTLAWLVRKALREYFENHNI